MGLPGFEPGSKEPKSSSLDQTSRQPLLQSLEPLRTINDFALIIKTLAKLQHLSKANQKAIWNRLTYLGKLLDLKCSVEVELYIYSMECKNNHKKLLFEAYERFCSANDVCSKKPKKLKCEVFVINVPIEQRIDKIIAC